jgi:hypothetical protein
VAHDHDQSASLWVHDTDALADFGGGTTYVLQRSAESPLVGISVCRLPLLNSSLARLGDCDGWRSSPRHHIIDHLSCSFDSGTNATVSNVRAHITCVAGDLLFGVLPFLIEMAQLRSCRVFGILPLFI